MVRIGLAVILFLFTRSVFGQAGTSLCSAPEYHQLDFWIGDWDVFEAGSAKPVAHVSVDRILDGCALHEHYEDTDGHRGQSFSTYDAGRKQWRQSWYTNRGKSLELVGQKENDVIALAGTDYDSSPQSLVRGVWKPLNGTVQETAVTSDDNGKTWKPWFDLAFRPAAQAANVREDQKAILQLDSEYQEAVKNNDAATIDRLLPEDFILQSSTGKTYTKTDVLNEAKNKAAVYEVQNDGDAIVRVWGSTAVITAKLHAKGTENGRPFDYSLWFSDTYTRAPNGWRYVFGQASSRSAQAP